MGRGGDRRRGEERGYREKSWQMVKFRPLLCKNCLQKIQLEFHPEAMSDYSLLCVLQDVLQRCSFPFKMLHSTKPPLLCRSYDNLNSTSSTLLQKCVTFSLEGIARGGIDLPRLTPTETHGSGNQRAIIDEVWNYFFFLSKEH